MTWDIHSLAQQQFNLMTDIALVETVPQTTPRQASHAQSWFHYVFTNDVDITMWTACIVELTTAHNSICKSPADSNPVELCENLGLPEYCDPIFIAQQPHRGPVPPSIQRSDTEKALVERSN